MVEKPLDELEQALEDKKQAKLAKKGILLRSKEEKRLQRRERERRRKHKNRRQEEGEEEEDFDQLADRVGFGEVVHAPPTLTFKAELWIQNDSLKIRIRPFRVALGSNLNAQLEKGQSLEARFLACIRNCLPAYWPNIKEEVYHF